MLSGWDGPDAPMPGAGIAPAASERRVGERHKTVLRIAKLLTARGEELCIIRNISAGGLMANIYSPCPVGASVQVEVKSGRLLSGTVRWTKGELAGVQFTTPIDVDALLGEPKAEGGQVARAPRLGVAVPALLRCGAHYRPVTLCDISQGGAKVVAAPWVEAGKEAVLRLPQLGPLPGTIRWRNEDHAGIAFLEPLRLKTLAEWLAVQPE